MEQTCHRCGALVSAGSSFCSHCGAPQVRVPETVTSVVQAETASSAGAEAQDAPSQNSDAILNRRQALRSASTAGVAMAIAAFLPVFIKLFPIWMLGGGWLAVVLYRRHAPSLPVSSTTGGKLGALAGLLAFVFLAVFMSAYLIIATLGLHQGEQIRSSLRAALQQAAASNPDARTQLLVQWSQTPEGLAMLVAISMFVFLVAFLLFSTVGGIFAASLSRRKLR